jgi:hypothetical protein
VFNTGNYIQVLVRAGECILRDDNRVIPTLFHVRGYLCGNNPGTIEAIKKGNG